jgi:hypothetical protein
VCRGNPHCFPFDANRFDESHKLTSGNPCGHILVTDSCLQDDWVGRLFVSAHFDRVKLTTDKSYISAVLVQYMTPSFQFIVSTHFQHPVKNLTCNFHPRRLFLGRAEQQSMENSRSIPSPQHRMASFLRWCLLSMSILRTLPMGSRQCWYGNMSLQHAYKVCL